MKVDIAGMMILAVTIAVAIILANYLSTRILKV